MLAILGLDIQLLADVNGNPGSPIDEPVIVGQTFWVEVLAEDRRPAEEQPAGLVGLPLSFYWNPQVIRFIGDSPDESAGYNPGQTNVPVPSESYKWLITPKFPLFRFLDDVDQIGGRIKNLRGGTVVANDAIGKGGPDDLGQRWFSRLQFEAIGTAVAMPFMIELAGTPAFADASPLDGFLKDDGTLGDPKNEPVVVSPTITVIDIDVTIEGYKWHDLDADGEWDQEEPGLKDWTLYLDLNHNDQPDSDEPVAVTDADGYFVFHGLKSSESYTVREIIPAGWKSSYPEAGEHVVTAPAAGRFGHAEAANFGNYQTATISGYKWHDLDADGTWDEGEPPLEGWRIQLEGQEKRTEADGRYAFEDLRPGTYTVTEVVPEGWTQSYPGPPNYSHPITVSSGQVVAGTYGEAEPPNFGNYTSGGIEGYKWHDLDGNGAWDPGEPGLVGWTIEVEGQGKVTADTQDGGRYSFGNLKPGTYTVREIVPDGWKQSYPRNPDEHTVTIISGQIVRGRSGLHESPNFGDFAAALKRGVKFEDLDGDGERDDGEPGLPGWTIHAYRDENHNHLLDQAEFDKGPADSGQTDEDGAYRFDLDPGNYIIVEVLQAGWRQSSPESSVLAPGLNTGGLALGASGYSEFLSSQAIEAGNDFGNYRPATIGGIAWEDLDADGQKDGGDPGLPGWTIHLNGLLTAVTDDNSQYFFGDLKPGAYAIWEEIAEPWTQSYPGPPNFVRTVTVTSGQVVDDADFGNYRPGEIRGYKWHDSNGDGAWNSGELGLNHWKIYVDLDNDDLPDPEEPARISGNDGTHDGAYVFTDLKPGTYTVREVVHPGWPQTYRNGTDQQREHHVTVLSGQSVQGPFGTAEPPNFGNSHSVLGVKWNDADQDGQIDAAEQRLSGWTILAYRDENGDGLLSQAEFVPDPVASDMTDAEGRYSLPLPPGKYILVEVMQPGWDQTFPAGRVLAPGLNTGTFPLGAKGHAITLGENQVLVDQNFGNRQIPNLSSLSGFVYLDEDGNGLRDLDRRGVPVEIGLPNVEVSLYSADGKTLSTTTTGSDGWYQFDGLTPGTYEIRETQPPSHFRDSKESLGKIYQGKTRLPPIGKVGEDRCYDIQLGANQHGIDYNFAEILVDITKRMFLASSPPTKEMIHEYMGVRTTVVEGTDGDDTIEAKVVDNTVQITMNAQPLPPISLSKRDLLSIDAKGGRDKVTLTGTGAREAAHFFPGYATLRTNDATASIPHALEASNAEDITVDLDGGDDFAVFRDSPGNDTLEVTDKSATMRWSDGDLIARVLAAEQVRAFSTSGGEDKVIRKEPVDLILELLGAWDES